MSVVINCMHINQKTTAVVRNCVIFLDYISSDGNYEEERKGMMHRSWNSADGERSERGDVYGAAVESLRLQSGYGEVYSICVSSNFGV